MRKKLRIVNFFFKPLTQPIGNVYFFEGIHVQAYPHIVNEKPFLNHFEFELFIFPNNYFQSPEPGWSW